MLHQDPSFRAIKPIQSASELSWHSQLELLLGMSGMTLPTPLQSISWPALSKGVGVVSVGWVLREEAMEHTIPRRVVVGWKHGEAGGFEECDRHCGSVPNGRVHGPFRELQNRD